MPLGAVVLSCLLPPVPCPLFFRSNPAKLLYVARNFLTPLRGRDQESGDSEDEELFEGPVTC